MNSKHIHVALNFLALLAINFFVLIPALGMTLFRNVQTETLYIVALLLSIAYLMLYQIEMSKNEK